MAYTRRYRGRGGSSPDTYISTDPETEPQSGSELRRDREYDNARLVCKTYNEKHLLGSLAELRKWYERTIEMVNRGNLDDQSLQGLTVLLKTVSEQYNLFWQIMNNLLEIAELKSNDPEVMKQAQKAEQTFQTAMQLFEEAAKILSTAFVVINNYQKEMAEQNMDASKRSTDVYRSNMSTKIRTELIQIKHEVDMLQKYVFELPLFAERKRQLMMEWEAMQAERDSNGDEQEPENPKKAACTVQ